jgi:uncharacterized SAM-binding protein YcdF (DUF218 family)
VKPFLKALLALPPLTRCALAAGLWLWSRGRPRAGRRLVGGALALLVLATCPPLPELLLLPLRGAPLVLTPGQGPIADAVLVLGADVLSTDEPGLFSQSRALYGVKLWRSGAAPRLAFSGGNVGPLRAARAMAKVAQVAGVPEALILVEAESLDTRENAANSARLWQPLGVRRVVLVTSPPHMLRARLAFEKVGFVVVPAPAFAARLDLSGPSFGRAATLQAELSEYLGLVWYALRGHV